MKSDLRTSLIIIGLSLTPIASLAAISSPKPRSFRDFYRSLVKNNSTYFGAILDTNASSERKAATLGAYYPTLSTGYSINSTNTNYSKALSSSLAGKIPELGLTYSTTVYNNTKSLQPPPESNYGSYSLELGLSLLKDFGPRVGRINFDLADYELDATRSAQIKTTYDLISQLITAYVGTLSAQKNLEINEANEMKAEEDLRKSKELYAAGKIPRLSLLTLQTQSQQIRAQLIQNKREVIQMQKNLYSLTAIDEAEDPSKRAVRLEPLVMPFFDESIIQELIAQKFDLDRTKNTEYISAKIALKTGKISVVQAENNLLPSLNLIATHAGEQTTTQSTGFFPRETNGNTVALALSVPLGLVSERHLLAASRISYQKSEILLDQLRRQLRQEWLAITEDYRLLKEQYQIARELAASAQLKYQAALPTASLGSTYQQNIVTFQNELTQSLTNLNQLEVELISLQFKILSFQGHPHALDAFRKIL